MLRMRYSGLRYLWMEGLPSFQGGSQPGLSQDGGSIRFQLTLKTSLHKGIGLPPLPKRIVQLLPSIGGIASPLRPGQILKQPVVHRPLRRGLPATTRIAAMSNHPGLDFHKTCVSPCSLRSPNPFSTSFSSSTLRHGASYVMLPRLQFFAAFGTKLQFSAMPTLFP